MMRYLISIWVLTITAIDALAGGLVAPYQIDGNLRMEFIEVGGVALNAVRIDPMLYSVKLLTAQDPELQIDKLQLERCKSFGELSPSAGDWCLGESSMNATINGREIDSFFLHDYLRRSDAILVQNGGNMASFSPPRPLGLVVSKGRKYSSVSPSPELNGFACFGEYEVKITADGDDIEGDCLQAGPLFLWNGAAYSISDIQMSEDQRHSFICTTTETNQIVMGVSQPALLGRLADVLRSTFNCENALRLSGEDTVGLTSRTAKISEDILPLQNVLGVFRKDN
ncbi:hypothetical protein HFO28_34615 [Rhizobium leguminosarum]|uniref:phosphodiester glycosidase family protein n=1 Tax=Rhizobium leguminosarum TaxID=384 RepID=UPI001C947BEB|nr:phosphodiester glycosidase family protein [Rhizobium leguminosarum]MBY5748645.1 hypothetical protein [Rhizobium leguminosarum]